MDIEPSPSSAEDLNWQFTCQLFRYQSDHLDNKTAGVAVSRNRNRGETKLFQIFSRLFLEQETKNSTDGQQSATCSKRISGRNICGTKMYLHELSIKMNEMVFAQHSDEPMKYQFLKQDYTLHMFVRCLLVSVIAFTLTLWVWIPLRVYCVFSLELFLKNRNRRERGRVWPLLLYYRFGIQIHCCFNIIYLAYYKNCSSLRRLMNISHPYSGWLVCQNPVLVQWKAK